MSRMKKYLYVLFLWFSFCKCFPLDQEFEEMNVLDSTMNLVQGDMILSDEQLQILNGTYDKDQYGNALSAEYWRWPDRVVPYRIMNTFSPEQINMIRWAMDEIEKVTCVRFEPARNQYHWVAIGNWKPGCHANAGYNRRKQGPQVVNLERGCFNTQLSHIVHELLHTLGLFHEQSRPDRDLYIRVLLENIKPDHRHNFRTYPESFVTTFGLPYDTHSIMQYNSYAFSSNRQPTMLIKATNGLIKFNPVMTENDILKIRKMYQCSN